MEFQTITYWDEDVWDQVAVIYHQAFGKGAKPKHIIKNMFKKGLCVFHLVYEKSTLIAFALTSSTVNESQAIIIDYLAVKKSERKLGTGSQLLYYIKDWVKTNSSKIYIVIEVEAEETSSNFERILFWQKNDFQLTDYIHHYKWVPKTYRAMYLRLLDDSKEIIKGEELFKQITSFHKKSFTKQ